MLKKIITFLVLLFVSFFGSANLVNAGDTVLSQDNILMKAFEQRKKGLMNIINGGELEQEIKNLKLEIHKIDGEKELNEEVKKNLLNQIKQLQKKVEEKKKSIKNNKKDLEIFLNEAKKSIEIKNNLIEKLNNEIEDNKVNKEKNAILLKKLSKSRQIEIDKLNKEGSKKYYIFFGFTFILIFIHVLLHFLLKYEKIKKSRGVYIKFFLIFGYTIFLIWFFFYLYPELSIFLIFISGYLLAINAHLIASFVGSIIILEKYKIGNIIKFGEFKGQIIRITTINTVLLPMTNEGIFSNKPIVIPNFRLLKEEVIKDDSPEKFIHNYVLKFSLDLQLDVLKLVENIEGNILMKHLNFRLNTLSGNEESFRTGMGFDRFGRIEITFTWKGEDILNKRIERKIMGLFNRTVDLKRIELEKDAEKKEDEKRNKEEMREKIKKAEEKSKKNNNKYRKKKIVSTANNITNREVKSLDGVNNWRNKK